MRATADGEVRDVFAQGMQMRRVEVERVRAFGNRTVFVPAATGAGTGAFEKQISDSIAAGYGAATGAATGKQ